MAEGEIGRVYSDGEVICSEGQEGDVMYVVQSGKVKITKKTPSGEVEIADLGSGEIFGEMALFDRMSRSATATAEGDARVLSVDKKKLFASISRDPTLVFKILESMSRRIRRLDEDLAALKRDKASALFTIEETCSMVLERARNMVNAENGSVMLLDGDGASLSIKAAFGAEADAKVKLGPGEGLAGYVLKTGRAELLNDVSMDKRFIPGQSHIRSVLCVPLKHGDRCFGVVNLSNSSDKLFSLDDLKVLDSLVTYASVAIQQAMSCVHLSLAAEKVLRHASMLDMI
jgi:GAF domain-containing protein